MTAKSLSEDNEQSFDMFPTKNIPIHVLKSTSGCRIMALSLFILIVIGVVVIFYKANEIARGDEGRVESKLFDRNFQEQDELIRKRRSSDCFSKHVKHHRSRSKNKRKTHPIPSKNYNSNSNNYSIIDGAKANPNPVEIHQTLIIDKIYPYPQSIKPMIVANYSFPGPMIEAYEGDTLIIRVINRLSAPTTLHWHGLFQNRTPGMDGAVGVSQCAIPPNAEMIYTFKAEPAGTSWYHGHLLEQYTDGLYGPLIIHHRNEPNQNKYDSEQILMVADWYNNQAHSELLPWYLNPNNTDGNEPSPDAIVVNGRFTQSLSIPLSRTSRVRFRIINSAALSMYTVSIDGLPLHIIELDQVDSLPYTVDSFSINVAQRVSFYVDLSELDSSYTSSGASSTGSIFIRFQAMISMYSVDILNYIPPYEAQQYPYPTFFKPLYLAILSFDGNNFFPLYSASDDTPVLKNAVTPKETNILDARAWNPSLNEIPQATHFLNLVISFNTATNGIIYAYLNNVAYSSDANYMHMRSNPAQGITSDLYAPLLHQMATKPNSLGIPSPLLQTGNQLPTIQSDGNGHYLVPYQAIVDIFLNNTDTGEHPFHLHGHKFWIVATSDYPQAESLYSGNYIQRDTVSIPALGWAKIRYIADKAGAWFFHCHIEWHMSAGLALVFITGPQELLAQGYTISQDQKNLCLALQKLNQKAK
ncbi:unnamed protein product [Adineta ricciae]|uniref:Multicopper oxidase n=2 Tax=Adineta ricciae TaxID=249248 RepID=A0A814TB15_ADIRI|nr:unnamed protein product [Adineta ricciae]